MSAQTRQAPKGPSMLDRSKAWLRNAPSQPDIQKAVAAIVAKVTKGDVANDSDCKETWDALADHYVEAGGDLCDLASLPDTEAAVSTVGENQTPLASVGLDYGNLYPVDAPAAPPLTFEEKQIRLAGLKAAIPRPGGFR